MELPADILNGITYLGNASYISEDNFKRITSSCLALLAEEDTIERVSKICPDKADLVYQSYAALLTLVIEALRVDADEEIFGKLLSKVNFKAERVKYLWQQIDFYNKTICDKLKKVGSNLPQIIDVSWRLDFVIKSSMQTQVGQPIYYIILTTEKSGSIEYCKFTCDLHQLQSLSTTLREIVIHIEKFSSS